MAPEPDATPPIHRVAWSITAHHKAYQLDWLFNALANDDDLFLIHVDARASEQFMAQVLEIVAAHPRVVMVPRRAVHWGRWTQVEAELQVMRSALAADDRWQHFVTLSGQDYPIASLPEIRRRLAAAAGRSYLDLETFEELRRTRPDDPHLRFKAMIPMGKRLVELPVPVREPRGVNLGVKGSSWHMLSRDFVEWVTTDELPQRIARALRLSRCPDEVFFQACLINGPFRERHVRSSGRFVQWPGPKILTVADRPAMDASDDLFARKFDAQVDTDVLHGLAATHGYTVPRRSTENGEARPTAPR